MRKKREKGKREKVKEKRVLKQYISDYLSLITYPFLLQITDNGKKSLCRIPSTNWLSDWLLLMHC